MDRKRKDVKKVLEERTQRKSEEKKKELKWLFGGFTENQIDLFLCTVLVAVALGYVYYNYDIESMLFPRSLSSAVTVLGAAPAAGAQTPPLLVRRFTADVLSTFASLKDNLKAERTLVLFHSQFIHDASSPFYSGNTTRVAKLVEEGLLPDQKDSMSILSALHQRKFTGVLWFVPEWSSIITSDSNVTRSPQLYHVGQLADNNTKLVISCPEKYFTRRGVYAPYSSMVNAIPFWLQIVHMSDLYRRRYDVRIGQPVALHADLSFFMKSDPIDFTLSKLDANQDARKYLRHFAVDLLCFVPQTSSKDVASFRKAFADMFSQKSKNLPFNLLEQIAAPTFSSFCDGLGKRHWAELHAFLTKFFNKTHANVVQQLGLPMEHGLSTISYDEGALDHSIQEFEKVVRAVHDTAGSLQQVSLSDDWQELQLKTPMKKVEKLMTRVTGEKVAKESEKLSGSAEVQHYAQLAHKFAPRKKAKAKEN